MRDLKLAMIVLMLWLAGLALPRRYWPGFARWLAACRARQRGVLTSSEVARIRALVGDRTTNWIETSYRPVWQGERYLGWLQILAGHWPRRFQPSVELRGGVHLEAALGRGKGAIIWLATFAHADLGAKAALAKAGYRCDLLSRPSHGFGSSRFAQRFLNPFYGRIERRYIGDNIVIAEEGSADALARVKQRLAQNETVIVYAVPLGRRTARRRFLGGHITLATGILSIACEVGAAVVPAFTIATAGTLVTELAPALPLAQNLPRSEAVMMMVDQYIFALEAKVRDHPAQFCFPLAPSDGETLVDAPPLQANSVDRCSSEPCCDCA